MPGWHSALLRTRTRLCSMFISKISRCRRRVRAQFRMPWGGNLKMYTSGLRTAALFHPKPMDLETPPGSDRYWLRQTGSRRPRNSGLASEAEIANLINIEGAHCDARQSDRPELLPQGAQL